MIVAVTVDVAVAVAAVDFDGDLGLDENDKDEESKSSSSSNDCCNNRGFIVLFNTVQQETIVESRKVNRSGWFSIGNS